MIQLKETNKKRTLYGKVLEMENALSTSSSPSILQPTIHSTWPNNPILSKDFSNGTGM